MRAVVPLSLILLAAVAPEAVRAQDAPPSPAAAPDEAEDEFDDEDATLVDEIVVTGSRAQRGAVLGDIEPEVQLDAREIRALGAGSLVELLETLAPQIQSGRGRGGERPVVLLNGRRTSGFREIRNIPPEAIQRIDILPEEVALKYGFRADQRVVNIVLRRRFRAITAQVGGAVPTQGGRAASSVDLNQLRITPDGRWNVELEHDRTSSILEGERDLPIGDRGAFRTLTPAAETLSLGATSNRTLFGDVSTTVNAGLDLGTRTSRLGFPLIDEELIVADDPGALSREVETRSGELGVVLNGDFSADWLWSANASYALARTETATDTADDDDGPLRLGQDRARSTSQSADAEVVVNGPLFELPAGPVASTFTAQLGTQSFESEGERRGVFTAAEVSRDRAGLQASVDAPVAERDGVLGALGDLTLNGNLEVEQLSDFGTLRVLGGGVNWSPVRRLDVIASFTDEDGAPTVQQLGDPVLLTSNVPVFDFRTGQTVEVTQVEGGAPDLLADNRRVVKLGLTLKPFDERDLSITANYTDTRITDPIATLPFVTPEIEAAFPERFLRDETGQLVQVDARPLNFARSDREELRWGFNYSRRIGPPAPPRQRPAGDRRRGERAGGGGQRGPAGGGFGGGRGFSGRPSEGRLQLSAYHTLRLTDSILIREGVPELDLLNGSAVGSGGGQPKHEIDLQANVFRNGLGARLDARWRSGTFVRGDTTARPGASGDLTFSDLTTVNLNLFADLGQRRNLIADYPWLRSARVTLGVQNLFDTRSEVTDASGAVPVSYLSDRVDPVGRTVRLSVRKLFF